MRATCTSARRQRHSPSAAAAACPSCRRTAARRGRATTGWPPTRSRPRWRACGGPTGSVPGTLCRLRGVVGQHRGVPRQRRKVDGGGARRGGRAARPRRRPHKPHFQFRGAAAAAGGRSPTLAKNILHGPAQRHLALGLAIHRKHKLAGGCGGCGSCGRGRGAARACRVGSGAHCGPASAWRAGRPATRRLLRQRARPVHDRLRAWDGRHGHALQALLQCNHGDSGQRRWLIVRSGSSRRSRGGARRPEQRPSQRLLRSRPRAAGHSPPCLRRCN